MWYRDTRYPQVILTFALVLGRRYVITLDSMNGSQLMGLDRVGTEIYNIHGYFRELTVGQRTLEFWCVTISVPARLPSA